MPSRATPKRRMPANSRAIGRVIAVRESELTFVNGADGTLSEQQRLDEAVHGALEQLPRAVRPLGTVLPGKAEEVLINEAEKGVDLLFLGSHGYGTVLRAMVGSVSSELMRSSPCPVLVVPR